MGQVMKWRTRAGFAVSPDPARFPGQSQPGVSSPASVAAPMRGTVSLPLVWRARRDRFVLAQRCSWALCPLRLRSAQTFAWRCSVYSARCAVLASKTSVRPSHATPASLTLMHPRSG